MYLNLWQHARFDLSRVLALALAVAGLLCTTASPALAQRGRSTRGAAQRFRALQEAQKKQTIATLQARYSAAQQSLTHAQAEIEAATGPLDQARSRRDAAETELKQKKQKLADAVQELERYEDQLVESQPVDSPVGKARARLARAQESVHAERHRVLELPGDTPEDLPSHLCQEYAHFSRSQKDLLKTNECAVHAEEELLARQKDLRNAREALQEGDPEWQTRELSREQLTQAVKDLNDDQKHRQVEIARLQSRLLAARVELRAAQQVLQSSSTQLSLLGARTPERGD